MLKFNFFEFSYDSVKLFEDISLEIQENKIGLIGNNGVGKTTLLNIIWGNIKIAEGLIEISDKSYYSIYDFKRYDKFSISDFIKLIKSLNSFDSSKVEYYIELLQLDQYLDFQIKNLSKGTQKKLGIFLTFLSTKKMLLIDEPFESIDEETNEKIITELNKINKKYIIVSHDIRSLQLVSEKIYQIKDRKLVAYD